MKKLLSFLFLLSITSSSIVFAEFSKVKMIETFIIINHYTGSLHFDTNYHHHIVPKLPLNFTLRSGERSQETPVRVGIEGANEAYIHVNGVNGNPVTAFFGVDANEIHGYLDPVPGLAFSWDNAKHSTITFCTSEEYNERGHC